jgi:Family of unknown function (DUF5990)
VPEGYTNIHVGVQRRGKPSELLHLVPGDAPSARWEFESEINGEDIKGPFIQGRPGDRFIYLSWGVVGDDGSFAMFRRAKLLIADIPREIVRAAATSGRLTARIGLTDGKGNPLCARVKSPTIEWAAS